MSKNVKAHYKHAAIGFSTFDMQHRVCWNQKENKCCDCNPHDGCLLPEEDKQYREFLESLEKDRLSKKDNK